MKNGPKIVIFTPFLPPFLGRGHLGPSPQGTLAVAAPKTGGKKGLKGV